MRGVISRRVMRRLDAACEEGASDVIRQAVRQLSEYFGRRRKEFAVPLASAGTEFQRRVWEELLKIPYGAVIPYARLAERIGRPAAARAVAAACAANPLSVFVPCHRVIGSGGRLGGYGGGTDAKRMLLALERQRGELPL